MENESFQSYAVKPQRRVSEKIKKKNFFREMK